MRRAVQSMIITGAVVGGLLVLRFLPRPRVISTPAQLCADSPLPWACKVLAGPEAAPEEVEPPQDLQEQQPDLAGPVEEDDGEGEEGSADA